MSYFNIREDLYSIPWLAFELPDTSSDDDEYGDDDMMLSDLESVSSSVLLASTSDSESRSSESSNDANDDRLAEPDQNEIAPSTNEVVPSADDVSRSTNDEELMETDYEPSDKKVCRMEDSPSAKSKIKSTADSSICEDDGQSCSICFEQLTNAGDHRVASLKCGHLFGHKCILTWLKGSGTKCPQCNVKAKKSDIRIIYTRSLKVQDTTEVTRLLEELEREKMQRRKAEIEMSQVKIQYEYLKAECSSLRTQVDQFKYSEKSEMSNSSSNPASINFLFEKSLEICKDGCCRVLSHCAALNMVAVSQPSTNALFPGYGVRKLSIMDFKTSEFIRLHKHPIRDMSFNPESDNGLLLSVSMDKSIKITSMLGNSIVQTYRYDMPLWSCAWNPDNSNQFFAGTVNGKILLFDTRNTDEHLDVICGTGSHSPVVSLQYVKRNLSPSFVFSGLLSCQLEQCVFYQFCSSNQYKPHILPVQGNFTSVNFDSSSQHFLLSSRPHGNFKHSRHLLGNLQSICDQNEAESSPLISCNISRTMLGGRAHKMLSRSKLVSCVNSDPMQLLACAGDESSMSTMVWDVNSDKFLTRMTAPSPVLDIATVKTLENQYVLSLTEKSLLIHRLEFKP